MNRLLVVGSRHDQPGEEQNLKDYELFFRDISKNSYEASHALLDDLLFDISPDKFSILDTKNDCELSEYKILIIRGRLREDFDAVFAISRYAKRNGMSYFNDFSAVRTTSKLAQAVNFFELKLPFPRTIYAAPNQLAGFIKNGNFDYPFIYKGKLGAHGNNNYLVTNKDELDRVAAWGMVTQQLVPNDGDYRVLVIGSRTLVIKRTARGGSHLNNTSQGGSAEQIEDFKPEIIKECYTLAKKFDLAIAGVDVIFDKKTGQYYFLEINPQPQLISGAFVEIKKRLLKDYLEKL